MTNLQNHVGKIILGIFSFLVGAALFAIGSGWIATSASIQDRTGSVLGGITIGLIGLGFIIGELVQIKGKA